MLVATPPACNMNTKPKEEGLQRVYKISYQEYSVEITKGHCHCSHGWFFEDISSWLCYSDRNPNELTTPFWIDVTSYYVMFYCCELWLTGIESYQSVIFLDNILLLVFNPKIWDLKKKTFEIKPTIFATFECHKNDGTKPMLSTCLFHFLDIYLFYFACWIFLNFLWIVLRVFNASRTKGFSTFSFFCLPLACLGCKCNQKQKDYVHKCWQHAMFNV